MSLTLIENFRAVFYAPFYAAFALGAFETEGIEVHLWTSPGPDETAQALASGAGEVSWGGPMRVMVAHNQNMTNRLVIFCEVVRRDPFFLIGRVASKKFEIRDLAKWKVATVSEVPTPWMCLQHDLREVGIEPESVSRVADQTMAENAESLRAGKVDVIQVFQPFAEELIADGTGHIWYAAAERGLTSYTAFYTTRAFAERDPDALLKMTRAMHRTLKWIGRHTGEVVAAAIGSYFPDLSKQTLADSLARYQALGIWNDDSRLFREGYDRLERSLLSGGLIQKRYPYEEAVDMRFAEQSLAEDPPSI